jgi:2-polyprenyl-3-methyl-5-hydroxy-6-metoxy-1,4-benzoquinol methylase
MPDCRICSNREANRTFLVKEMQFGFRDEFEYFECANCGCLQISEIPEDLPKYYPADYYPFQPPNPRSPSEPRGLKGYKKRFIRNQINYYYLNRNSILGAYLEKRSSLVEDYSDLMNWMKLQRLNLGLNLKSRILDVGCGVGHLLQEMAAFGFSQLTGVDLFINDDISYDNGVKILKGRLDDLDQRFDFIMLHHSFEHMPEPLAVLRKVKSLLNAGCYALIRIPVAGSYAWEKYGVNWVALDAPRHLHLHTRKSMKLLAAGAGLQIADVVFDAVGFGITGSEQYLRDIPLMDPNSFLVNPNQTIFTEAEMVSFNKLDEELNKQGRSDCAGFYLYKDGTS